jgi:O-antigen ligase
VTVSRVLDAGLFTAVLLVPFAHLSPFAIPGRVALVAAGVAGLVLAFREARRPVGSLVEGAFLLFVALSAASVLVSVDLDASGRAASKVLLRQLVLFLLVAGFAREAERRRSVAAALGLSGLFLAFDTTLLFAGGTRNVFGGLTGRGLDYNTLCMLLLPALAALLALSTAARKPGESAGWGAAAALVTAASWATFSRIGWGALVILVAAFVFASRGRRARPLAAVVAGTLLFLAFFRDPRPYLTVTDNDRFLVSWEEELTPAMTKRMALRDVLTMNSRLEYAWEPSLRLVAGRPFLGAGYGPETFAKVVPRDRRVLFHEHSAVLAVAVQSGVPAALAFGTVLLALAARLGRSVLRAVVENADDALRAGLLATVVGVHLFQGLGEPVNSHQMGLQLAIVAGLAVALPCRREGAA